MASTKPRSEGQKYFRIKSIMQDQVIFCRTANSRRGAGQRQFFCRGRSRHRSRVRLKVRCMLLAGFSCNFEPDLSAASGLFMVRPEQARFDFPLPAHGAPPRERQANQGSVALRVTHRRTAPVQARRPLPVPTVSPRSSPVISRGHQFTVLNRGVNGEEIDDMLARAGPGRDRGAPGFGALAGRHQFGVARTGRCRRTSLNSRIRRLASD